MNNMNKNIFCNNCNTYGHYFHSCRKPFISNGIIAFRNINNTFEYLIIRRKNSFGYIDFIRGKYSLNNKNHIIDLMNEMTINEKKNILEKDFEELWIKLWGKSSNNYSNEKSFASDKFKMLKLGIYINNEFYNTELLLKEIKTEWTEPEWGFPKGRKNLNEEYYDTALREWSEESGFNKNDVQIISNIKPYNEFIIGSNYEAYQDSYFVGKFIGNNNSKINFQKMEISDAKWATYEDICKKIRPYQKERLKIIKKVNTLLNKYTLIYI